MVRDLEVLNIESVLIGYVLTFEGLNDELKHDIVRILDKIPIGFGAMLLDKTEFLHIFNSEVLEDKI